MGPWSPYPRRQGVGVLRLLEGSAAMLVVGANLLRALRNPGLFPDDDVFGCAQVFWRWKPPESRFKRYALGVLGLPLFLPFQLFVR